MTAPQQATQQALAVLTAHHTNGTLDMALAALGVAPSPREQFWHTNLEGILFWREFVKAGGFQLDPLMWSVEKDATAIMAGMIEAAIIKGWDASKAAADFLYLSGVSCDLMRADINTVVAGYDDFGEMITAMFSREITRAHLGSAVACGCADQSQLDKLDLPPEPA